jgi:hypothetical protein
MPLPEPSQNRTLRHTRKLSAQAYKRDDGLWDIDVLITDAKTIPLSYANTHLPRNAFLHELWLRVTVDQALTIVDACASSDSTPYKGVCNQITPSYSLLKGLNLFRGFRQAVAERLGGTKGCTHLTELCNFLPSAAIQAFAGDAVNTVDGEKDAQGNWVQPFHLDRCHALALDGAAVKEHYPQWYKKPR